MEKRLLSQQLGRVESGPTKFGDDWCGVFIRGDEAIGFSFQLKKLIEMVLEENPKLIINWPSMSMELHRLQLLLESCDESQPAKEE